MATIVFNQDVDPNNAFLNIPNEIDPVATATSTLFEVGDPRFTTLRLEGSDFTYTPSREPSGGIITGFSLLQAGKVLATVTGLPALLSLPEAEMLRLSGTTGALLRYLLSGDDVAAAGAGDQVILSEDGNDTLDGGEGADYISAGDGNDLVISGLGQGPSDGANEVLIGGDGIDRLIIDRSDRPLAFSFDLIVTSATTMIDGTRISAFEQMKFHSGAGNDVLAGGTLADIISTGPGNDRISGREGDDTLSGGEGVDNVDGGSGNDFMTGDEGIDVLDGGSGNDTLSGGDGADNIDGGFGNDFMTGDEGIDILEGGGGNDTLDGGIGLDFLLGGPGDDVYRVDNIDDTLFDAPGAGFDIVIALSSYALTATAAVEVLRTSVPKSKISISLTGNGYNNYIEGNAGGNILRGRGGSDTLMGGRGHDTFFFDTKPAKGQVDRILDYRVKDDSIRLSRSAFDEITGRKILSKNAFQIGKKAADPEDRIIYNSKTGGLFYDEDGTGHHKALLFAWLPKGLKLTAADFLI